MNNEQYFGGCAWHSMWVKDCLSCNPTETCAYYPIKQQQDENSKTVDKETE